MYTKAQLQQELQRLQSELQLKDRAIVKLSADLMNAKEVNDLLKSTNEAYKGTIAAVRDKYEAKYRMAVETLKAPRVESTPSIPLHRDRNGQWSPSKN